MNDFQNFLDENLPSVRLGNISLHDTFPEYDLCREVRDMIVSERKRQKITQKRLSELTGISQANICNIENGTTKPTIDSLKRIGDALGMRVVITFEDMDEYYGNA